MKATLQRYIIGILFLVLMFPTGCAKFPEGTGPSTLRELSFVIIFNAPINNDYFYFIPIDTSGGDVLGPVPVFPGITTGEGWVTGAATHYVQYHQGQYTVFKINNLQPFSPELIGVPVRSIVPNPGSAALDFTIDLNQIQATGESIDVNVIAIDQPFADTRLLDALGPQGTTFLNIDITTDRTITNSDLGEIEPVDDVLNQDRAPQPPNDQTRPLDIIDFTITTNI